MYCKNCGTDNNESSKFCRVCGAPMERYFGREQENCQNDGTSVIAERNQIQMERVPDAYKPISMWGYFGYQILFAIPLVGFICLIVFAVSAKNKNLKNFAGSYFCVYILFAVVALVAVILLLATGAISSLDITELL